ncbi:MAG: hypothetical protein ACK50I_00315 [Burkholderiales bacterium]
MAAVSASASRFMKATIRMRPSWASCAIAVTSPTASQRTASSQSDAAPAATASPPVPGVLIAA